MDDLFLDVLHLAADAAVDRSILALSTQQSGEEDEYWFLPVKPETVLRLDIDRLVRLARANILPGISCVVELDKDAERIIHVKFAFGGSTMEKAFPVRARNTELGGNSLEVRIWPNFLFLADPALPKVAEDRVHYFRIRQDGKRQPPMVLARVTGPGGNRLGYRYFALGRVESFGNSGPSRPGQIFMFPASGGSLLTGPALPRNCHCDPIGLYFEGRGLILLNLSPAHHPGGEPDLWRVGIDFGTSNTCVVFRPFTSGVMAGPQAIQFLTQTASLYVYPKYERGQPGDEGAAPIYDFPYRYADEDLLTEQEYFPTQLVTLLKNPPPTPNFRLGHGLIYPRNAVADNPYAGQQLHAYPPAMEGDSREFRLMLDLKWTNRAFRRPFLWHLYKMLVLHAARHGALIAEAAFSFPRAFTVDDVRDFSVEVQAIFEHHGGIPIASADIISESIAVHDWVQTRKVPEDHLVLDVGGGTTDYLGLFGETPAFQASYCLAAGTINQYFLASRTLRRLLLKAINHVVAPPTESRAANRLQEQRGILQQLLNDLDKVPEAERERANAYCQQAVFGMLSMIDENSWPAVAAYLQQPVKKPPNATKNVHGFFLTLLLLYAGLTCQGARLMRQHNRYSTNLRLLFIGNGSRYCRFLSEDSGAIANLLQGVIRDFGPNRGVFVKPEVRFRGKSIVAEGLTVTRKTKENLKVAVLPDLTSQEYLLRAAADAQRPDQPAAELAAELTDLLVSLDGMLDHGRVKDGDAVIVPYCEGTFLEELQPLLPEAVNRARAKELKNAAHLRDSLRRADESEAARAKFDASLWQEAACATEPVFITRLGCLLDLIRERYAH